MFRSGPAKITDPPRDQIGVTGGIISFFCRASGNPKPTFEWRKNGKRISGEAGQFNERFCDCFPLIFMEQPSYFPIDKFLTNRAGGLWLGSNECS